MSFLAVGIDPGVSGGLGFIADPTDTRGLRDAVTPTDTTTFFLDKVGGGLRSDLAAIKSLMSRASVEVYVGLEQVGPGSFREIGAKAGVASTWKFAQSFFVPKTALEALDIPYLLVPPQMWQKLAFGGVLGPAGYEARQDAYTEAARRRWPAVNWPSTKKEARGCAAAMWIAYHVAKQRFDAP